VSSGQTSINVTGDVTVRADGTRISAFDQALNNVVTQTNGGNAIPASDSGIDFSAADLNSGGTPNTPGAAIIGVAGMVQAGKNNVGLSLVVNMIAQRHLAMVRHAFITSTGGDVYVIANDNSKILGVAVGLGVAMQSGVRDLLHRDRNAPGIGFVGHATRSAHCCTLTRAGDGNRQEPPCIVASSSSASAVLTAST